MLINTIYLDMDGVLVNFNDKYFELFGVYPKRDPLVKENWFKAVDAKVFRDADEMSDAKELLNFVLNTGAKVEILSSCSWRDNYLEVMNQKIEWLEKNNLQGLKQNFVRTPAEKAKFATPSSVLIDDTWECIRGFIENKGEGILHQTSKLSIMLLTDLINN